MTAYSILEEIGERQGWNKNYKLALALEYIENQGSLDAWQDFLQTQADEENEYEPDL